MPLATAAAEPPLDPPVVRFVSHGLRVGPYASGSVGRHDAELGCVGAADADEAGVEIALRERVGVIGAVAGVAQELHALVVRIALDAGHQVLDDERHSSERAVGQRARALRPAFEAGGMDDRVQLRVQLLDARDRVVDELDRRRLSATHELGLRGCVEERRSWEALFLPGELVASRASSHAHRGPTIGPRRRLFELRGDPEQKILAVGRTDELHADGQAVW